MNEKRNDLAAEPAVVWASEFHNRGSDTATGDTVRGDDNERGERRAPVGT